MRRREFIAGMGGAVVCAISAHSEQRAVPVIGRLASARFSGLPEFIKGLGELGFVGSQRRNR
jgi:hypothetical protein